jgi:ribosome-binding protein aMBF1 (putative translation factor)
LANPASTERYGRSGLKGKPEGDGMAVVRSATKNEGGRPPVYELSDFGSRLKRRLDQRGWSRNTLSRETGINASTLWRWMVGKASPPVDKVVEIASTVGCKPADLIPAKAR